MLLIAGLGDPVEAWQPQLDGLTDRCRMTAFDNRGVGHTPLPDGPLSAETMADDVTALLRRLEVRAAHVAGFSMAFSHEQSVEAFQAQVDACLAHDTADGLSRIAAPRLVIAGELDIVLPPRFGRSVSAEIPNAPFEVMPGEAHQPFQEVPDKLNARIDAFWRDVDASA